MSGEYMSQFLINARKAREDNEKAKQASWEEYQKNPTYLHHFIGSSQNTTSQPDLLSPLISNCNDKKHDDTDNGENEDNYHTTEKEEFNYEYENPIDHPPRKKDFKKSMWVPVMEESYLKAILQSRANRIKEAAQESDLNSPTNFQESDATHNVKKAIHDYTLKYEDTPEDTSSDENESSSSGHEIPIDTDVLQEIVSDGTNDPIDNLSENEIGSRPSDTQEVASIDEALIVSEKTMANENPVLSIIDDLQDSKNQFTNSNANDSTEFISDLLRDMKLQSHTHKEQHKEVPKIRNQDKGFKKLVRKIGNKNSLSNGKRIFESGF